MRARTYNAHSGELREAAASLEGTGRGVKVRLSYVGLNAKNKSGYSDKFYEVGMTPEGAWYARWGKNGTPGQGRGLSGMWEAYGLLMSKEAKGYQNTRPVCTFHRETAVWLANRDPNWSPMAA